MTTEPQTEEYAAPFGEPFEPYVQIPVPGIPYSAVKVALWGTDFDAVMQRLHDFQAAYSNAFDEPQDAPETKSNAAPQRNTAPAGNNGSRPAQRPQNARKGSGLFCPDHQRVELVESNPQYQTYDIDEETGQEVPAKYFCPGRANGTGQNHSVWRSKAVRA